MTNQTNHSLTENTQTAYEMLTRWLSTMDVYHHAICVLRHQLPQTAKLVEESTKIMSERFVSLATDIKQQSKAVEQISELSNTINNGNEQITLEEFTDLFSNTLNDSIEKILFVSKRAITMIYTLDETIKNIASIETFVTDIQNITKKANLLALNASIEAARAGEAGRGFSVVANEVKEVSNTIREIAESINSRITTVSNSVKEGYEILQDVATTDMSQTIIAQDKLATLMCGMIDQKNKFSAILKNSADVSGEASNTLSGMVVNLQFQDRTTQYVESSVRLLEYMDKNIASLKEDNIRIFPELKNIKDDESLAEEVTRQFQLSEFAKLFQLSIAGVMINSASSQKETSTITNAVEEVELF